MLKYNVTATVKALDVTSTEKVTLNATDPDDACGKALGELYSTFGDDAGIWIQRIGRDQFAGNAGVLASV